MGLLHLNAYIIASKVYQPSDFIMKERREELIIVCGFAIDCIKEFCGAKHIKVYGNTKDALVEKLLGTEFPSTKGAPEGGGEPSMTMHLMEMVLQMQ